MLWVENDGVRYKAELQGDRVDATLRALALPEAAAVLAGVIDGAEEQRFND